MLVLQNISVSLGQTEILHNISLELNSGQMVVLCGPNGAGKSTLLKVISGELKPSCGSVSWDGIQIEDWTPNNLAKTRGKLSQESRLSFPFRTQEVVEMGRFPYGKNPNNGKVISQCMKLTHIEYLYNRRYNTLSGGEKQRLHFARVLAQITSTDIEALNNKVLLLDEPTSALDLKHQESLLRLSKRLATQHNCLVIVVLHDLNLAAAWADQMIIMKKGEIKHIGSVQAVCISSVISEIYDIKALVLEHPSTGKPIITVER